MNISRRDALKQGAGLAALLAMGPVSRLAAAEGGKKIPVGLQLYSVRNECAKDLPAVLKAVSAMGYKGVEFAGYHGRSAADLRKLLDDNGLVCCGTHTALTTIAGDALPATIDYNKTIGNKYLIVPSLPHDKVATAQACKDTAKLLTEQAAKAKEAGMRVGYHAHGGDFKKIDGETVWDLIFSNSGAEVVMQLDTCNCLSGGGDPVPILKKYPGRSVTVHLKEFGGAPGSVIGEGKVAWKDVFETCESIGGTEWYIVEHESGTAPLDSVKGCFEALKKMGKV
jgi:sugar phosphate isomerase/epimerase